MNFLADLNPRWRRWIIVAAALWFVLCLLWTAPASLFAALVQRFSPLQLDAVEGSFWRGSAAQAYVVLPSQRFALGRLEWQLRGWSLLLLHPRAHIATDYGQQLIDTTLYLSPTGKLHLRDTRAALPIKVLGTWLPLPADGLLAFNLKEAQLARSGLQQMRGEVLWQQAGWQWSTRWLALGDYRCQVQMEEAGRASCDIDGGTALVIDGKLVLNLEQKNYQLQAQVRPADNLPKDFRDGLGLLLGAQADAQGSWQVRRDGRW